MEPRTPEHTTSYKSLILDMAAYLSQLEDWDITEDQKREFIATLWYILRSFAELGFEIQPCQLVQKLQESPENTGNLASSVLQSNQSKRTQRMASREGASVAPTGKESPCTPAKH